MKQYSIILMINDISFPAGSIFGEKYKIQVLSENSMIIRIIGNNDIIYSKVADNIDVVEKEDNKVDIVISDRTMNFI